LLAQSTHQRQLFAQIKYVIDGKLSIIEDGQTITATAGDAIFFPAGSVFTILPTVFTAF
jgi:ethanolamine utilization protein EutQ (cupin superfamily)